MADIKMYHRYGDSRPDLSIKDYKPTDNAQPTSRVLDCDTEDCWAAEEWAEPGIIKGEPCMAYYLFYLDETIDDDGNPLEGEFYPFDDEHISRIIIDD